MYGGPAMGRATRSLAAAAVVLLAAPSGTGAAAPVTGWSVVQITAPSADAYDLNLTGISCTVAGDCWAVGTEGIPGNSYHSLIEHWDGSAWTFVASPASRRDLPVELHGIGCTASTSCWAVGRVDRASSTQPEGALIERWDGRSWTVAPAPPSLGLLADLNAVDCPDPKLCYAVGVVRHPVADLRPDASLVLRWNGDLWTLDPTHDTPVSCPPRTVCGTTLRAVGCGVPIGRQEAEGATACLAVGSIARTPQGTTLDQPVVEELRGGSWRLTTVPRPPDAAEGLLTGVSCVRRAPSPKVPATPEPSAVATATPSKEPGKETHEHSSTRPAALTPRSGEPSSASVTPTALPRDARPVCLAVGYYDHEAQYRFNGRQVSPWSSPYALAFEDGRWSLQAVPAGKNEPTVRIGGVICGPSLFRSPPPSVHLAGPAECLAVGDSSLVETLPIPRAWVSDGSSWSDLDTGQLGHTVNSLSAVSCIPRTACVATGWTIYESATTTAAAFAGPPGPAVQAAASERRQAVIATYSAPSAPAAAGGPPSEWPRTAVAALAAGIALAAGLVWTRRRRHRTRDMYGDR